MKNEFFHTSFILNNYISRHVQYILKKHFHISFNEYLILVLIGICWKSDLSIIIEKTWLTPAAVTILVKKLQEKWYLIITTQKQDSRKKTLKTTEYGSTFIHEIEQFIEQKTSNIFSELDKSIIPDTQKNMKKIIDLLYKTL
jgi:DNA-binding MarR family transcriptional regulator